LDSEEVPEVMKEPIKNLAGLAQISKHGPQVKNRSPNQPKRCNF